MITLSSPKSYGHVRRSYAELRLPPDSRPSNELFLPPASHAPSAPAPSLSIMSDPCILNDLTIQYFPNFAGRALPVRWPVPPPRPISATRASSPTLCMSLFPCAPPPFGFTLVRASRSISSSKMPASRTPNSTCPRSGPTRPSASPPSQPTFGHDRLRSSLLSRSTDSLELYPFNQVPIVILKNGMRLAQMDAILRFFARVIPGESVP